MVKKTIKFFKNLIKKQKESRSKKREEEFLLSVACGRIKKVIRLIKNEVDVNAVDEDEQNALMLISPPGYIKMIEILIKAGVDVNAADKDGWTPLIFAAYRGAIMAVKILVEAGANINATNNDGQTALEIAIKNSGTANYLKSLEK